MLGNSPQGLYTKTQSRLPPIIVRVPFAEYISVRTTLAEPQLWQFSHRGTLGFSLYRASEEDTAGLDGAQDKLFEPYSGEKLRYRVSVPGYETFNFQKYAYSTRRRVRALNTRAKVVMQVADVVARFVKKAAQTKVDEDQLQFGPGHLEFSDLYLLELRRTGSTVQIVLGYGEKETSAPIGPAQPIETSSIAALHCREERSAKLGNSSIHQLSPRSDLPPIQPGPGLRGRRDVPGAPQYLAPMSGSDLKFGLAENSADIAPPMFWY